MDPFDLSAIHSLSVAAPAYNEAAGIESVLRNWVEWLSQAPGLNAFEIVVCNDGSEDNTKEVLDLLGAEFSSVRPVHHNVNQGAAAALSTAIRNTRYDWVLLIDSDGQYGIDNLNLLASAIERDNSKAAIGVRVKKHDSAFARIGSRGSSWLCNFFHGTHYRDFSCALKLVEGDLLRSLRSFL
jgi:glycosyltransferase involved in cell wall biosynthesis